ncbi:hypothetical protein PIB30_055856 [Stylosanthes scabra]|uniref:Uncharacterized protein n=1 Tax=Stylosanthes scabra TaxID=79078 RepID=A0ABU6SJZ0_9FABA|nr:hypothetical protein [Stylosanthes scabra]
MGSGVRYYEIEKREEYKDSDEGVAAGLAIEETRRYHFDDESHLALRRQDSSKGKDSSPQRSGSSRRVSPTPQYFPLSYLIRLGSPSSPSKIVPPTQGQEGVGCEKVRMLRVRELVKESPKGKVKLRGLREKVGAKKKEKKKKRIQHLAAPSWSKSLECLTSCQTTRGLGSVDMPKFGMLHAAISRHRRSFIALYD